MHRRRSRGGFFRVTHHPCPRMASKNCERNTLFFFNLVRPVPSALRRTQHHSFFPQQESAIEVLPQKLQLVLPDKATFEDPNFLATLRFCRTLSRAIDPACPMAFQFLQNIWETDKFIVKHNDETLAYTCTSPCGNYSFKSLHHSRSRTPVVYSYTILKSPALGNLAPLHFPQRASPSVVVNPLAVWHDRCNHAGASILRHLHQRGP